MQFTKNRSRLGLVLLLILPLAGCKHKKKDEAPEPQGNPLKPDQAGGARRRARFGVGAQRVVNEELLRQFGIYYAAYRTENGRPPRTLAEFRAVLAERPERPQPGGRHRQGLDRVAIGPPAERQPGAGLRER